MALVLGHGLDLSLCSPVNLGPFLSFCSGGLTATEHMTISDPQRAHGASTAQRFSQVPVNQLLKSSRQNPRFLFLFPPSSRPSGTRKHFPEEHREACIIDRWGPRRAHCWPTWLQMGAELGFGVGGPPVGCLANGCTVIIILLAVKLVLWVVMVGTIHSWLATA